MCVSTRPKVRDAWGTDEEGWGVRRDRYTIHMTRGRTAEETGELEKARLWSKKATRGEQERGLEIVGGGRGARQGTKGIRKEETEIKFVVIDTVEHVKPV
jgi:hypothetical protein